MHDTYLLTYLLTYLQAYPGLGRRKNPRFTEQQKSNRIEKRELKTFTATIDAFSDLVRSKCIYSPLGELTALSQTI